MKLQPRRKRKKGKLRLPQDRVFTIIDSEANWYKPGSDPLCHRRLLAMTRGIYLINEWWKNQNLQISFPIADQATYLLYGIEELETAVRTLHKVTAPKQEIENRELVFGNGATQVINAYLYAVSLQHNVKYEVPLYITHKPPGYIETKDAVEALHQPLAFWVDYAEHGSIDPNHLLEFVTTPSNPDGTIQEPGTKAHYVAYDRINHWSLFLQDDDSIIYEETLKSEDISIFSLSKLLSFSGSRVGYAFVKDKQIAKLMRHYIILMTHGLVRDGEYHCLQALKYLLSGNLSDYTSWIRKKLQVRWSALREAIRKTPIQLLNKQGPNAWIQTPEHAYNFLLKKYQIEATYGPEYGAGDDYARINMLVKTAEFNEFIWRLTNR